MTIDEYGKVVCEVYALEADASATWGHVVSLLAQRIEQIEQATPPQELLTYHQAVLNTHQVMMEVAKGEDAGATHDPRAFFTPEQFAAAGAVEAAKASLTIEVQSALECQ